MILPTKHIKPENSVFYIGAMILTDRIDGETVSTLWDRLSRNNTLQSFDQFVVGMDFLFLVGAVEFKKGLLRRIK
jgi:hypothetical protein